MCVPRVPGPCSRSISAQFGTPGRVKVHPRKMLILIARRQTAPQPGQAQPQPCPRHLFRIGTLSLTVRPSPFRFTIPTLGPAGTPQPLACRKALAPPGRAGGTRGRETRSCRAGQRHPPTPHLPPRPGRACLTPQLVPCGVSTAGLRLRNSWKIVFERP